MQIICPQCATRLQLSAPKLPDHPFTIKCPKCQQGITVSPATESPQPATTDSVLPPPSQPESGHRSDRQPTESVSSASVPAPLPTDAAVPSPMPPPQAEAKASEAASATERPHLSHPPLPDKAPSAENNMAMGWTNSMLPPTATGATQTLVTGQNTSQDLLQALATLLTGGAAKSPMQSNQFRRRNVVVCLANPEDIRQIEETLKNAYEVTIATSPEQVTSMLQTSHELDILLLDPNFHAGQQGGATIMRHLNMLNPARRRRVFVVVTSHAYRTMDMHAAFAHGVNMIVNSGDLEALPEALSKSIQDFNSLYRAFNQVSGIVPF